MAVDVQQVSQATSRIYSAVTKNDFIGQEATKAKPDGTRPYAPSFQNRFADETSELMKDASEEEQEEDFIVPSKKNAVVSGPSKAEREQQIRSMMEDEGRVDWSDQIALD